MKASELKKLLKDIPDDVELVVGDPDCGMFWNPVSNDHRVLNARRVTQEWAETQIRHVNFFALFHSSHQPVNADMTTTPCTVEVRALQH